MSNLNSNPKEFWEKKIVDWEDGRYGIKASQTAYERIADRLSQSVRFRLEFAGRVLEDMVAGKSVTELGCGSAFLAERLLRFGAVRYQGFDIAGASLARANERFVANGIADRAHLESADVSTLPAVDGDIVFSLGLLDWLSADQIATLFRITGQRGFLHSMSEKRASLTQYIHRSYVHLAYGAKTKTYRPQYYDAAFVARLIPSSSADAINVIRHKKLRFGVFLTNLALPVEALRVSGCAIEEIRI